jgi:2-oxoglutarate ferredoxin oxidoreductase subunit alpha
MKKDDGKPYERYALTESGISPMAIPGMAGGEHETNSTEHNSWGAPTNRFDERCAQMDKRLRKLTAFDYGEHWADIEGDGDIAVVTWGSCTPLAREVIERAKELGIAARLISIRLLSPPQVNRFAAAIDGISRIMVLEQSHSQQFHRYLWANFHDHLPRNMLVVSQPGPLPLRPGQVLKHLVEWR